MQCGTPPHIASPHNSTQRIDYFEVRLRKGPDHEVVQATSNAASPHGEPPHCATRRPAAHLDATQRKVFSDVSSTLRILYRVAERFHESFAEGGWNFHVIPVVPGH
jgi:hypothetical protein